MPIYYSPIQVGGLNVYCVSFSCLARMFGLAYRLHLQYALFMLPSLSTARGFEWRDVESFIVYGYQRNPIRAEKVKNMRIGF